MAKRGDVLVSTRPIGFVKGKRERFLVLQSSILEQATTVIVCPLIDEPHPLGIPIDNEFAMVHLLRAVPWDRFDPKPAGTVPRSTLLEISRRLRAYLP